MNKIIFILCLITTIFLSNGFAEETIRIATGEYPPFLSENLKYNGVGLRIIREAFALEGVKVEYGFFPWKRSYQLAIDGDWDATATWADKPGRDKDLYFSNPLYESFSGWFHLKTYKFDWKTLDDLKGIPIGAISGYTYDAGFLQAAKEGRLHVEYVSTEKKNFQKLLWGRIKIFRIHIDVGYAILAKEFSLEERKLITHHPHTFPKISTYLLFSKKINKNREMVKLFNNGLKQMKENGKIDQYFKESRAGEYLFQEK